MQVVDPGKYSSSLDCMKKTVAEYGFRGLYRGVQFPLIGSLAENGLTFISYGFFKRLCGVKGTKHITFSQMLFSSMGSGATISLLLTPVELLKCRLQIEQSQPKSVAKTTSLGVIRNVLKTDGFTGLFRGLSLTLLREVPGTSIWMIVYELSLKPFIRKGYTRSTIPLFGIIAAGSISGATYWASIYPIDTIKSILQTDTTLYKQAKGNRWAVVARSLGVRGMFRGLGCTLIRAVPANAVLFLSFEYAYRVFNSFF
ncbi:uncharacterized protein [Blastocystis hominis]|uniref:Mitochondrial carrier protein n=1 Tax=Blastocystis hominis TaxID=12968 RepID=D8MA59_BLAHO|nr:uncharacterized protein [Blastocystis hominis]CBK24948.2 unnamed protein product [Blastocystis hominis]|eukprot:XP_012898996.1 uncharacterized protein [Blastocystis hominis]